MGFLTGKKFLITGISSNRSIAYGIAKACAREGAELALSYNNERFKERVQGFADEFGAGQVIKLDASSDESIDLAALELANRWTAVLTALSTRSAGRPRIHQRQLPRRRFPRRLPLRNERLRLLLHCDG